MIKYESKTFSQNGEDGILAHIFNVLGITNKVAVEIGIGNGVENNTRLLSTLGWQTHWFDINDVEYLPSNCTFTKTFVTIDNIVNHFKQLSIPKEFDLLSIDIDSNDFYIREALKDFSPRVCVMEYNGCYDKDIEYVMPYNENYRWKNKDTAFGASLLSYTIQANTLGYDLVYCDKKGVNAFFVRKDINQLPVLTPNEAWVELYWYKDRKI